MGKPTTFNADTRRAMVIVAHPDDAEYGCSGTVAKLCREGWEVTYVLCTDGSKGSSDMSVTSEQLIKIREQEQIAAGKMLGLKGVEFLRHPDGYLQPTLELRKDIARQIRKHRPHTVITQNPTRELVFSGYIGHPDHFAAGEAALSAVYPAARDHLTFPELYTDEGYEPWKVSQVLVMMFREGDFWIPLSEADVTTSVRALHAHTSQIEDPESTGKWMRERRETQGQKIGASYAETFKRFNLR